MKNLHWTLLTFGREARQDMQSQRIGTVKECILFFSYALTIWKQGSHEIERREVWISLQIVTSQSTTFDQFANCDLTISQKRAWLWFAWMCGSAVQPQSQHFSHRNSANCMLARQSQPSSFFRKTQHRKFLNSLRNSQGSKFCSKGFEMHISGCLFT